MSRIADMRTIWIASPEVEDDGELTVIGYKRLRSETLCCVPASGYRDTQIYGDKTSRTLKFSANQEIDISEDGNDGIWLSKPRANSNGLYENPEYISSPLNHFGKIWSFDAQKRVM